MHEKAGDVSGWAKLVINKSQYEPMVSETGTSLIIG